MLIMFLRTVILYLLLVLVVRLMGKRQVGEMEPAEFVVTMLLANLAAGPMQDVTLSLASAVVPILAVLALELVLAVLTVKSVPLRSLLCGKPALLIANGRIDQRAMAANRICMDELAEQLREKDVFDLRTVKYAILETDGELTVLLKRGYRPATARDAGVDAAEPQLPWTIVSDGRLLKENLALSGRDIRWLNAVLKQQNAAVRDLFLLTVDPAGAVYAVRKEPPRPR